MEENKVLVNDDNMNVSQEEEAGLVSPIDDSNGSIVCCNSDALQ